MFADVPKSGAILRPYWRREGRALTMRALLVFGESQQLKLAAATRYYLMPCG